MRLSRITLRDFKAFSHAEIQVAPITVLIGPNNAGKSTVLQALALLAQSAASSGGPLSAGHIVDLGLNPNALARSDGSGCWEVGLSWDFTPEETDNDRVARLTFLARAGVPADVQPPNAIFETLVSLLLDVGDRRALRLEVPLTLPEPARVWFGRDELLPDTCRLESHGPYAASAIDTATIDPAEAIAAHDNGQSGPLVHFATKTAGSILEQRLVNALAAYRFVGPGRHVESSVLPLAPGPQGGLRTAADVANMLAYDRRLAARVSDRCMGLFGFGVAADLVPDRQVRIVATKPGSGEVDLVNQGSGFIQLLWVLLHLELAGPGATWPAVPVVGIDEPELHLHPSIQLSVARVLSDFVKEGLQVLCTTQSEHFLMAVLDLVLEGVLSPADVAVYYVDAGTVDRLEVDAQGRLSGGLRGFFEANEDQLKRRIDLLVDSSA